MTRAMAAGVFDILHLGHVHYLTQAAKHGDELVVVVATDASVRERKRPTVLPEDQRVRMVQALDVVDQAVLGHEQDHYLTVEEVAPDVIVLGHDDHHSEADVQAELQRRDLQGIRVARADRFEHDIDGTRKIIRRILDLHERGLLTDLEDPPSTPE